MRRWLAAAVLVLALLLAGCGWKGQGTVVEKLHSEPYTYTTTYCAAYDTKSNCTVWAPQVHYVPEVWGYRVRDLEGEEHDVETTYEDWAAHKVGDHFDNREEGR